TVPTTVPATATAGRQKREAEQGSKDMRSASKPLQPMMPMPGTIEISSLTLPFARPAEKIRDAVNYADLHLGLPLKTRK
ncbi:MAG: hypothetical protein NWS96_09405, partial [Pseudomonadales bacterium]|nr:hypothetical protein [Pseudomonadales bacterium]MDP4641040.1 hypothetical protein [Pseudomonadales bacterium]MDP4875919.1 hypothetical protein [Pseudomonadales bacterium]MDP4912277.1 hypothetical protein [Pseudomonadales bacterium]MDP5058517.1 hypothetical protein [Pseudomonadales bacterium]